MTLVWSLGVSALVPTIANATGECPTLSAGELVRLTGNTAVFMLNTDYKRLYFPNSEVYHTWYSDFSGVNVLTQTCFNNYPAAGAPYGVSYRPGSMLVKEEVNNTVYAVTPMGVKVALPSEAVAAGLYGTNWSTKVRDINSAFWTTIYPTVGTALTSAVPTEGMLVKKAGSDSNYFVKTGKLYLVSGTLGAAASSVQTVSDSVFATLEDSGSTVTSATILDTLANIGESAGTPATGGDLNVSLSANTPSSATLPKSATNVDVLKVNLKAGSTAVTVDEVTVKRSGAGLTTGLTAYLYDGEVRLGTSGRSFASDSNEADFTSLGFVVPANTTKVLTVRLQTGATAGEHNFSVTAINSSLGTTVTGLPVTGNTFSVSGTVTAGTLVVDGVGSISNPTVGDMGVELTKFSLTAASEDEMLTAITLKQDGTITTSELSNFKLYQGTVVVPTTATLVGRYLTLTLDTPYKLVDGSGKTFTVVGDISANADVSDTIIFYMNNAADIKAVGTSYGYGALADISAYNAAGDTQTLTLQGGGLTISNLSASAHDVKTDSTEVELAKVAMKAVDDTMEIQKMTVSLATVKATDTYDFGTFKDTDADGDYTSGETLLLRNVKLKDADTGKTLGSAQAITDASDWAVTNDVDTTLTFVWTDYFTLTKGTTRNVIVVADINSAQVSGVVYTATFDFSGSNVTVKDSKDNAVTDIVPASTIAGKNVTTRTSSLTISRSTTPETRTVVKGSTVDALGLIFAAGSGVGNDVKVSGLTVNVYVDNVGTTDGTFVDTTEGTVDANELVSQVSLYDGTTLVAGPVSVDSSGNALFTSSKFVGGFYTVTAGSNKNLILKAVVSGNAPFGGDDDRFAFTFAAGDVTAEDADGTVTPTVTGGANINGTTSPSVYIQITGNGTITTAADGGMPSARVLLAKAGVEQEVHRIQLTTTKEDFVVDELTVMASSSAAYDDVASVRLYNTSGVALSDAQTLDASGNANFTGLNISVPKNGSTTVVVKAVLNVVGERTVATSALVGVGADSGDYLEFRVGTTSGDFHAIGTSGFVDEAANAAIGNTMVVRNTSANVAMLSVPITTLASGQFTIMKFTVTADANADVVMGAIAPYITFNDSDSGNELNMTSGTLYLYDVTSGDQLLNAVAANGTAVSTTGYYDINVDSAYLTTNAKIGAGQVKTYEVRATFAGVETGDSVNVQLKQDTGEITNGTVTNNTAILSDAVGNADGLESFIWSDTGADTNGAASLEWTNSYRLLSWPTTVITISKS